MNFHNINRVMSENPVIKSLFNEAMKRLKKSGYWQKACNDSSAHAPLWHQFPLLQHIDLTIAAAVEVFRQTGIDLVAILALHDLGKIDPFITYCQNDTPANHRQYQNHEDSSAKIAAEYGFSPEVLFLLRWHDQAYSGITPANLLKKCGGDKKRLTKLLLVFACDAAGKGWVPNQQKQRPQIAAFIEEVCNFAGLPEHISRVASAIILRDQPKAD